MKLLINYDFFNAVKNVNETLHPMKVIRNEKTTYMVLLQIYLAVFLIANQYKEIDIRDAILITLRGYGITFSIEYLSELLMQKFSHSKMDLYAKNSSNKLMELSLMLNAILDVNTTYDMLLEAELYYKTCHLKSNNGKLPVLKSEKYLYIPSYGFDGQEKTTSILQEHIIGTKKYMLSVDEPDIQYRRVLSKSHI